MRVRVRLFALQRELAGTRYLELELPDGATVETGWQTLVARHPVLAPGRPSMRFARNGEYADVGEPLADGDELACIPPVSGGSARQGEPAPMDAPARDEARERREGPAQPSDPGRPGRIVELRSERFGTAIVEELAERLATPADGAVVAFLGRTRITPGTPAPDQVAEAARHAGRDVETLEYEAHESMALRILGDIADEIEARFGVERLAIVHRTGDVPLGEPSVAVVAVSPHRGAAFDAARYAIDETKARAPIWKAERFADGHVWTGAPARSGPPGPGPAEEERGS